MPARLAEKKYVFVCGLHRSGTSPLFQVLREHPDISGFCDTGVPEDEGQHLQTVMPPAGNYGGPGMFGFARDAHLTEESELLTDENRVKLFEEWSRHWDMSKPYLLEKSPPDLIRTRFLQAAFPNAHFVVVTRHPVAVALATMKWGSGNLASQIRHWVHCHRIFEDDRPHLKRVKVVRFRNLVDDPKATMNDVCSFLGIEKYDFRYQFDPHANDAYFSEWQQMKANSDEAGRMESITSRFENQVRDFGFSLKNLSY